MGKRQFFIERNQWLFVTLQQVAINLGQIADELHCFGILIRFYQCL